MQKVELGKNLLTGNEKIDAQHLMMFKWANRILRDQDWEPEYLVKVINFLINYIKYHFKAEEHFMLELGYPKFDQHENQHKLFIDKVLEIRKAAVAKEDTNAILARIHDVFNQWLIYHIGEIDRQYIEHIRSRNLTDQAAIRETQQLIEKGVLSEKFRDIEEEARKRLDSKDKKMWLNLPDLFE